MQEELAGQWPKEVRVKEGPCKDRKNLTVLHRLKRRPHEGVQGAGNGEQCEKQLEQQERAGTKGRWHGDRAFKGTPCPPSQETAGARLTMGPHPTHSEATKACSLMVCRTSENLILVVRVCPW